MKVLLPLLLLAACATTRGTPPDQVYDDAGDFAQLFELRVPVPERTRTERWSDDNVRGVFLKRRDLHWLVERRGGGLPASPLPMPALAERFAAAFGVAPDAPATEVVIGDRPAARVAFVAEGQYRVVHTVFDGGWVYGIQVSGPPQERHQVDAYSDAIIRRTEFPAPVLLVPEVEPTLADLGVSIPYLDGWHGMGEGQTVARVSTELGVAVVVTRSLKVGEAGQVGAALRQACSNGGEPVERETNVGVGLVTTCATEGRQAGEFNQTAVFAVEQEDSILIVLSTAPIENAAQGAAVLDGILSTLTWAN